MQITVIKNGMGEITADPAGMQKVIRKYCEEVYAHKFNNFKKWTNPLKSTNCQNSTRFK